MWEDSEDSFGKRPESIEVKLLADGTEVDSATLTEAGEWKHTFEDLPVYSAGKEIEYTIDELEVEGYEAEIGDLSGDAENGYTITITNTLKTGKLIVKKTWEGIGDEDDLAKYQTGLTITVSGNNINPEAEDKSTLTLTWDDVKDGGREIDGLPVGETYSVREEITGPETGELKYSYTYLESASTTEGEGTIAEDETAEVELVNKYEQDKGKLKVTKTVEGLPADLASAAIYLVSVKDADGNYYALNGAITGTKEHWVEIKDGADNAALWQNLPVGLTYTVTEKVELAGVAGYVLSETTYKVGDEETQETEVEKDETAEVSVTNKYEQDVTEATIVKVWEDNENAEGHRPETLTVTLQANGKAAKDVDGTDVSEVTLPIDEEWTAKVENLPKYDAEGKEITYTWSEDQSKLPAGYSLTDTSVSGTITTLTNTYAPGMTSVQVTKIWEDNDNQDGKRPESVFAMLTATAEDAAVELDRDDLVYELTAEENWTYIWSNLPEETEDGKEITYTVTEVEDADGTAIEDGKITFNGAEYTVTIDGDADTGYTITNNYTPGMVDIPVEKIWDDHDDEDGVRPDSVLFILYANDKPVDEAELKEGEDEKWTYTFENLPAKADGEDIVYTVKEYKGYDLTDAYEQVGDVEDIDGVLTITNRHEVKTEVTVEKVWDDAENRDGKRPETLKVTLSNGTEVTLNEANSWRATVGNLPKYDEDGEEIEYTWAA